MRSVVKYFVETKTYSTPSKDSLEEFKDPKVLDRDYKLPGALNTVSELKNASSKGASDLGVKAQKLST